MNCNNIADIATTAGTIITFFAVVIAAIGVLVTAKQLSLSRKLAQTTFEDSIDQQYRLLARDIPVDILIDECKEVDERYRELIFNYLDLCNEQIYLRAKERVSHERWQDWCTGIEENLSKESFKSVWEEVKSKASFTYLNRLEDDQFSTDPKDWV